MTQTKIVISIQKITLITLCIFFKKATDMTVRNTFLKIIWAEMIVGGHDIGEYGIYILKTQIIFFDVFSDCLTKLEKANIKFTILKYIFYGF